MLSFRQPTAAQISHFLESQNDLDFSYAEVGATRGSPPIGYNLDHNRIKLGEGQATYERAIAALNSWRHFELGWVNVFPNTHAPVEGLVVAVQAQVFGIWLLNACRVVYVLDEDGPVKRLGFAYGTLPDHAERGEERFMVEMMEDGSVWYDLYALSRPSHLFARLATPVARKLQKRFAEDSLAAMCAAVR